VHDGFALFGSGSMTAVLITVLGVLPARAIIVALRTRRRSRDGLRALARVTGKTRDEIAAPIGSEYSSRDLPVVEFEDDSGKLRRITLREEIDDSLKNIAVFFPRGRPQDARIDRPAYLYVVPFLLVAPAICLALIYAALWLYVTLSS
jgi:hypothetical protein